MAVFPCTIQYIFVFLLFYFLKKFYLFIFYCVGSSLLRAGFLQLWRARATLHCGARASHCSGFSCCGARALGAWVSVIVAHRLSSCGLRALECRLSSCGARAQLLHGMWDLPRPGLEPMSPALAGGFLTTAPPGKPAYLFYTQQFVSLHPIPSICPSFSPLVTTSLFSISVSLSMFFYIHSFVLFFRFQV